MTSDHLEQMAILLAQNLLNSPPPELTKAFPHTLDSLQNLSSLEELHKQLEAINSELFNKVVVGFPPKTLHLVDIYYDCIREFYLATELIVTNRPGLAAEKIKKLFLVHKNSL